MLHSIGEYEAELGARYKEAAERLGMKRPRPTVRRAPPPLEGSKPVRVAPVLIPAPPREVPVSLLGSCSWRVLLTLVALRSGVSEASILGWSRIAKIREARHDAIALIYTHTGLSTTQVGQIFSGRDHTTVLYSLAVRGLNSMAKAERTRAGRVHPRSVKSTLFFPPISTLLPENRA